MSFKLSISATEEKNSIYLYDCTGNYNPATKNGYGIPNVKIEDVTEAFFEIKTPNFTTGDNPIIIDVFPDMPNKEGIPYEVLPYSLNMQEIESGEYKIKYTIVVKDKNGTHTYTAFYALFCVKSVTCCIDKKAKEIRSGGSKDEKQKLIIELSNLLQSVKYQIDCGNYDTANEDTEYLKTQCKCCGCS